MFFLCNFFFFLLILPFRCEGVRCACLYVNVCVYINVPLFRKLGDWSNVHILTISNRNEISVKKTVFEILYFHRKYVYNHLCLVKFNGKETSMKKVEPRRNCLNSARLINGIHLD